MTPCAQNIFIIDSYYMSYISVRKSQTYHMLYYVYKEDPIFESLTATEVEEIIDDDALNVSNEQYVFEAVVSWVNSDPANRVKDVPSMLRTCRLALIDSNYFIEVVQVTLSCDLRDVIVLFFTHLQ